MGKNSNLRDRTACVILDAAGEVLSEFGNEANMNQVADTAGVGRATLYRYFPSREALLKAMSQRVVENVGKRLEEANLEEVSFEEAIHRITRAILGLSFPSGALIEEGIGFEPVEAKRLIMDPICKVFEKGAEQGAIRSEFSLELLSQLFIKFLRGGSLLVSKRISNMEDTAFAISSLFLDGVRNK